MHENNPWLKREVYIMHSRSADFSGFLPFDC